MNDLNDLNDCMIDLNDLNDCMHHVYTHISYNAALVNLSECVR